MTEQLQEQFLSIIGKHCSPDFKGVLSMETTLEETGIDSLGMAETLFELEDAFQLSLPEADESMSGGPHSLKDIFESVVSALSART